MKRKRRKKRKAKKEKRNQQYIFARNLIVSDLIAIFIGRFIIFNGLGFENISEVTQVSVVKIEDKYITISPGVEMNHGEITVDKIRKPLLIPLKENDIFYVRYHIKDPTNMHFVLPPEFGAVIIVYSLVMLPFLILIRDVVE